MTGVQTCALPISEKRKSQGPGLAFLIFYFCIPEWHNPRLASLALSRLLLVPLHYGNSPNVFLLTRYQLTSKPIPALRHTATHSSPSPKPICSQEGPGSRKTAYLTPSTSGDTLDADLSNRTRNRRRRVSGPARPPASRTWPRSPTLKPQLARSSLPALPSSVPARWSANPLVLPVALRLRPRPLFDTHSATSVPGTSPTRGRRPGPALYGRGGCRKLLWLQLDRKSTRLNSSH